MNHKLEMIKLNDFKSMVLPFTRKLIEEQVAYYGLKSTIQDLEQEKERICAQLEAVEMFPAIAHTYSAKDPDLNARLAYFSGLKANLEAELADCNQKIKIHTIRAEELEEIIEFCIEVGLPVTLKQLGIEEVTKEKIMAVAKMEGSTELKFLESFTAVMIVYWLIVTFFNYVQKRA